MGSTKMQKDLYARLGPLLANDATSLKQAVNVLKLKLIVQAFTQTMTLVIADLTFSAEAQLGEMEFDVGPQESGITPVTKDQLVRIIPIAGGMTWQLTSDLSDVVQIHGLAVLNNDSDKLWLTHKLDNPVEMRYAGEVFTAPDLVLVIPRVTL